MRNINKFLGLLLLLVPVANAWSQENNEEKVRYSRNSMRRYSMPTQDRDAKIFLPNYHDMVKEGGKGITWEEWREYLLSEARFSQLDRDENGVISREEMIEDLLQGEADLQTQSEDAVPKLVKQYFPGNSQEKLQLLKKISPKLNRPTEYVVDKNGKLTHDEYCQYPGCQEVWTKVYVQANNGSDTSQQLCTGHYAILLLQEHEQRNSTLPLMFALILIGLTSAVTMLTPLVFGRSKNS